MASLGLSHWLMIGGALLVLSGFIGFALSRNKEVETDPAPVPSETNKSGSAEVGGEPERGRPVNLTASARDNCYS
jgi:hypothetical protein